MEFDVRPRVDFEKPGLSDRLEEVLTTAGDVFHSLEYLFAVECVDGDIYVAHSRSDIGAVAYPFVRRIIPSTPYFDIITPYEYGGPVIEARDRTQLPNVADQFDKQFRTYCRDQDIVSEFVRFDPVLQNQENWTDYYSLRLSCENVVVDLSDDLDSIMSNYHRNNRRDIRLAERRGVTVTSEPVSTSTMDIFDSIYTATMEMKDARGFYFFEREFYKRLTAMSPGTVRTFIARNEHGLPIAASLFLCSSGRAHYFLSGSLREYSSLCASNLLIHSAISRFREEGFAALHLGGAAPSQRGLIRFKTRFSPKRIPYFVGERIHDLGVYNQLTSAHNSSSDHRHTEFFPAYRAS